MNQEKNEGLTNPEPTQAETAKAALAVSGYSPPEQKKRSKKAVAHEQTVRVSPDASAALKAD